MNNNLNLTFHPVDKKRCADFEQLFESKGGPKNCWCMVWRATGDELKHTGKVHRKNYMKERINEGIPVGLLAYLNNEPVARCSVAPRETYRELGGDDSLEDMWSLVCFYIKRPFREQRLSGILIDEALKFAKSKGAKYVEAYPVDLDSSSYRFMGYRQTFEKKGFHFIKKAGIRRNVVIKKV